MEEDYASFVQQLAETEDELKLDPKNDALLDLKKELLEGIRLFEEALPHLKDESNKPKPSKASSKNETHVEEATPTTSSDTVRFFSSGDQVQARRRGEPFSPATILSVVGPPNNPNYIVRFKVDRSTLTVPGHDVRPLTVSTTATESKKRKVEDDEASAPANLPAKPSNVISAPAALNPEFLKQKEKVSPKSLDESGREKKSRKVGSSKRLEENRSSWQAFQGSYQKKQKTKESMFRTGEGLNARVGVIGSGQGMRKDQKRQKNEYARVDDYDD